ncbi:Rrf2 family transcriptional regulator [Patescibacteria group bacterium]|nr:Rrf2 family transcriptional regulator [Patescibacteria group bacterium]MCL5091202.1 Rrf2 family transcriptional regulator [Patescibacteria group bacterium]
MFNISKQADYGLIIISYLLKEKKQLPLAALVKMTALPQRFLARVAALLVHGGLLVSKEGRDGGYRVSNKVNAISLYDYLLIFESEVNFCSSGNSRCRYEKICSHKDFLRLHLNGLVARQLKQIKLHELFN